MDRVQSRLSQKQDEKRAAQAMQGAFDDDEDEAAGGVVIDEEELMYLREMKDLKKAYRETYEKLKQVKVAIQDAQMNIDGMKHQMVIEFERWYSEEFEVSPEQMQQQMLQNTIATY